MDALAHRRAIGRRFGQRISTGDAVFLESSPPSFGVPCTFNHGGYRALSGVNAFVLMQVMQDQGWRDSRFFTSTQIREAGWSLAADAKPVCLQYLVGVGSDGLPVETASVKVFQVFNAAEVVGISSAVLVPCVPVKCLQLASVQAGFPVSDTPGEVIDWLTHLQSEIKVLDSSACDLRVGLAQFLLNAHFALPTTGSVLDPLLLAEKFQSDPLSFFHAVADAEVLVASVMTQVRGVYAEMTGLGDLEPPPSLMGASVASPFLKVDMPSPVSGFTRTAVAFQSRQAVLSVSFADRNQVKTLGALWHVPESCWFVPKAVDLSLFKSWIERPASRDSVCSGVDARADFRDALLRFGLDVGEVECDGEWHNVRVLESKVSNNKSGSYIFSLDGSYTGGAIGSMLNKVSGESFTWKQDSVALSPEQRESARVKLLAREAASLLRVQETHAVAAAHAVDIWAVGQSAVGHGYVVKKGISAEGLKQVSGAILLKFPEFVSDAGTSIVRPGEQYLIAPLCNVAGDIRGLQVINHDGSVKTFMRGAQKKGAMLVLGALSFDALAASQCLASVSFVEGLSTGASLRQATGLPVVVCFDAGNLETVVANVSPKLGREVVRVLAVDDDQFHVERALGFLADKLAINPHAKGGEAVNVLSGALATSSVGLGDVVADGLWHQSAKGSYCCTLARGDDAVSVRSLSVDAVPLDGGRKVSATFVNRGVEAGLKAFSGLDGALGVIVKPSFVSLQGRPSDWNDLVQREGVAAVRAVFDRAGVSFGMKLPSVALSKVLFSSGIDR